MYGDSPIDLLERDAFGVDHRELGASVFHSWFFPQMFVDIAREHGSLNIVSPHKQIILIVSMADMITDLLGLGIGSGNEEKLAEYTPHSPVGAEDVQYYMSKYLDDMQADPLLQQCQELFQLESMTA